MSTTDERILNKRKDKKEREIFERHFKNLAAIRKKYDADRANFPGGLDGGSPDENREDWEEKRRFWQELKSYLFKRDAKNK